MMAGRKPQYEGERKVRLSTTVRQKTIDTLNSIGKQGHVIDEIAELLLTPLVVLDFSKAYMGCLLWGFLENKQWSLKDPDFRSKLTVKQLAEVDKAIKIDADICSKLKS
jgi:hypothetical protein